jgi:hypothetical protein
MCICQFLTVRTAGTYLWLALHTKVYGLRSYSQLLLYFCCFLLEAIPVFQLPQLYAISIPSFRPRTSPALSRTISAVSAFSFYALPGLRSSVGDLRWRPPVEGPDFLYI